MTEGWAWTIFFLPLASFVVIAFVIRPFFNRQSELAGYLTIAAVAGSLVLSLWALAETRGHDGPIGWDSHLWFTVGGLEVRIGILLDSLTAIMAVVVCGVSLMVQVYSQGYMRGDPGYARYYAFMSLFTASMLGLVLARSILQMYVFWELVGLCSYLLIGFWFHKPSAARAAMKAFVVTRLGDLGFLLAILYLFFHQGAFQAAGLNPLEIPDIHAAAVGGLVLGTGALTWIAIGIFAGAAGKSAQFPLHVWLPDAMEGPTPVSALIHAATMVAAGVFLVARFFPVFDAAPDAMTLVAIIGGFTALFAASMAMVMYDIKRVVAYSTISQLGYMMLALGVGAYAVAIFHLFTHAFFKALLFLGAGSANHATGTFDMRYMGGLRRYQPWTYWAFLAASLSLAGVFPLAGFWSKDEILGQAWLFGGPVGVTVFLMGAATAFMTAFYIFRVLFMTFHGDFRGGVEAENQAAGSTVGAAHAADDASGHGGVHLAESPSSMVLPMLVLAVLSVVVGVMVNPPVDLLSIPKHWLSYLLDGSLAPLGLHFATPKITMWIAVLSVALAAAGIGLAWLLHGSRRKIAWKVELPSVHRVLSRRYYMDELYEGQLTDRVFLRSLCRFLDWFDRSLVDEVAEKMGWFGRNVGRAMALIQTGQLQAYGTAITVGLGVIVIAYYIWG